MKTLLLAVCLLMTQITFAQTKGNGTFYSEDIDTVEFNWSKETHINKIDSLYMTIYNWKIGSDQYRLGLIYAQTIDLITFRIWLDGDEIGRGELGLDQFKNSDDLFVYNDGESDVLKFRFESSKKPLIDVISIKPIWYVTTFIKF